MNRDDILDQPLETSTVKTGDGRSVTSVDGWTIGCDLADVQPGDLIEYWGAGFGFPVRGLAVGGRVAWYRTEPEQAEYQRAEVEAIKQRRRDAFERMRPQLDAEFRSLPECFRQRIQRFRDAGGPDWRWEYEPYEMMVCVDAVKIAEWCVANRITIGAFADLPWEQQKSSEINDGHSGNSFGCAVELARLWPNPAAVIAAHGALVPLVGCEAYGCDHKARP